VISLRGFLLFTFIGILGSSGQAQTSTFNDKQLWLDAIGGNVNFSLDFNTPSIFRNVNLTDAPPDAVAELFPYEIDPAPFDLGLLRIQANRFATIPSIETLQQSVFGIDGSTFLFIRTEAEEDLRTRLLFDIPVFAFGADVGALSNQSTGVEDFEILIESVTGEVETIPNNLVAGRILWHSERLTDCAFDLRWYQS